MESQLESTGQSYQEKTPLLSSPSSSSFASFTSSCSSSSSSSSSLVVEGAEVVQEREERKEETVQEVRKEETEKRTRKSSFSSLLFVSFSFFIPQESLEPSLVPLRSSFPVPTTLARAKIHSNSGSLAHRG
jgi:hypothetical protein